ncbi:hypothetical protein CLV79_11820 [Limimaricola soesokkakensis]|uniref:Uncharacterized protein n=1 Tax=Limimaricola soesokkakensis TaxID=1343159 RepID=A0A1X7A3E4_9RHOB|nr:hypothetical protein [Limimaricola soesokkakensis]PSK80989.1 hypothetical protein CLV79_11820 [Limimaricola soesokkakensis]SLN69056.1 hypothetical protein LOS8367_03470 [Limimaricola soesokkakensis]
MKRHVVRGALIGAALISSIGYAEAKRRASPAMGTAIAQTPWDADETAAEHAELRPGEWRLIRRWVASCLAETPIGGLDATALPVVLRIAPDRRLTVLPQLVTDSRPPGRSKMAMADLETVLGSCGVASLYEPPNREAIDLVMLINPVTGESRPLQRAD